jgi:rod shape-determining protein MreC
MEYSPPPLFKQGAPARVKVIVFALISIALLVVDSRLRSLEAIRGVIGTMLYPVKVLVLLPRNGILSVGDYFYTLSSVERENAMLRRQRVLDAQTLQQASTLSAENAQLRRLLGTRQRSPVPALLTEILYDARDVYTRKIVINRGSSDKVILGLPVIDDMGVVGQVTRVFPFSSEVTLLTDKDQAIPVQVVRSGLRSVAYGVGSSGELDLRFMAANADIKAGDMLVTSGIDGVYPAGLAVARVGLVDSKPTGAFARISCQPLAGIDRNKQLLILMTPNTLPPRPAVEEVKTGRAAKTAPAGSEGPVAGVPLSALPPPAPRTSTVTAATAAGTTTTTSHAAARTTTATAATGTATPATRAPAGVVTTTTTATPTTTTIPARAAPATTTAPARAAARAPDPAVPAQRTTQ